MTDRENQRRLDTLSMQYLTALDAGDFDTIDALWEQAATDPDLGEMLHALNAELSAEPDTAADAAVVAAIEKHLPSADILRPATGPLTVAEVADFLRKNPPKGLTTDDLKLNDALRATADAVPAELGISQVVGWGRRFGAAPEAYWKAFRAAALKMRIQRESAAAENFQTAARPGTPKPGGQS
jgi:hypothetical protein